VRGICAGLNVRVFMCGCLFGGMYGRMCEWVLFLRLRLKIVLLEREFVQRCVYAGYMCGGLCAGVYVLVLCVGGMCGRMCGWVFLRLHRVGD